MRFAALWSLLLAAVVGTTMTVGCASRVHPVVDLASRIPQQEHGYTPPTTAYFHRALPILEARVAQLGVTVKTVSPAELAAFVGSSSAVGATGWVDGEDKLPTIFLPTGQSVDARFLTLAHEAAHAFQPNGLRTSDYEVFAELVAWELSKHYGRDTTYIVARYLANWKESLSIAPALKGDIQRTVGFLLGKPNVTWE